MSAHIFEDLTTTPIFEDAVYQAEALGLLPNEDEEMLDEQLAMSALESGIEDPYRYLSPEVQGLWTAVSALTVASEPRSSISVHSRESQSTGMTSHPSRTSKDNPAHEPPPALTAPRPTPRPSLSLEYYDTVMDRFRPGVRHRHSSSDASAADSLVSTTSSLQVPSKSASKGKHKRANGLFSMFRKDSSTSNFRLHHHDKRPTSPDAKLECGHSLSKYELGVRIQQALGSTEHVAPHCCGKALPRSVLETVLSEQETTIVMNDHSSSPVYETQRYSGYGEDRLSSIDLSRSLGANFNSSGSFVTPPSTPTLDTAREEEHFITSALANQAFKTLRAEQKELFQRVALFESNQRKALSAHHHWTLNQLASRLESTKQKRTKEHVLELERLDEFQVVAEHELRKSHDQETQNVATALKYMEAYCSGSRSAHTDTTHTVTEEDRRKLARERLTQKKLPAKHGSAINVLRARQEKDTKAKLHKQTTELQQLDASYEQDKQAEEAQFSSDQDRLDALAASRRRRIMNRWELKFEMWRRDWENQHGTTLKGRLPHEEWPTLANLEGPVDSTSSLALYLTVLH
ncbi:hypothetical protein BCR34DRAFT_620849 [Clohesyomyces aquaticus]|uniref:Uncharacterized protein n=1 Tax=Clohesyomyces aquaticus TaxID=1231657 RepID=A0A1Y2ABD1_9PLEO|nr:hypothetical protein BCR34DRAFT_620849 [Clohesyomyces aquaticus]